MSKQESSSVKIYHTIGEVADFYGVNTSLIRYYAEEFPAIKPHKNKKGNRLFTASDMECFAMIFKLIRDEGLSLSEIKTKIAGERGRTPSVSSPLFPISPEEDMRSRLMRIKGMLEELRSKLDRHQ